MARPKLDAIVRKLDMGKDFSITRQEYINLTGSDVPQDKNYTEKRSAIAKRAIERGYELKVIPERLEFHKV